MGDSSRSKFTVNCPKEFKKRRCSSLVSGPNRIVPAAERVVASQPLAEFKHPLNSFT